MFAAVRYLDHADVAWLERCDVNEPGTNMDRTLKIGRVVARNLPPERAVALADGFNLAISSARNNLSLNVL